jgi:hypothetical protein
VITRINGEGRKARRETRVDVVDCFEVIGVRPHGLVPSSGQRPKGRVIEHLLRGPREALHFSGRLLGEHGPDSDTVALKRPRVTARGESHTITDAGRRGQTNGLGIQIGNPSSHCSSVVG